MLFLPFTLRLVAFSRLFWAFVLVVAPGFVNGQDFPLILHRARQDSISVSIHTFERRSPADITKFGAGLGWVSSASDKQSYFTVIKAGDISFRVALDTASSDLWLVSSECETETCKKVPRYPLSYQSPSFISMNDNKTTFYAHYADDTFASGFVARETVQVANMTLPNQTFGVATESNVSLTDQASGLMGLGFPRLSSISNGKPDSLPFFSTLATQGLLEYPLFAVSLTRNSTGTLTLGAVDSSIVKNASRIGWNKVAPFPPFGAENNISSYLQWAIPLDAFTINNTQFTPIPTYATTRNHSLALFDIGTPGIYGPYQDVSRIFATIDGARLVDSSGQWAIPCDTTVPLSFTFGLLNYTILPTDYIIGPASGNPNLCLSWPRALPPSSDGIDWQIGSAFLRTVYSIFSFGINTKEPPMIGLYSLYNSTNITAQTQTSNDISAFLSSASATVSTTLPNFLVPTPTFSTPPYALNTSISASIGAIVASGLANTTYSALLGQKTALTNISALPIITPPPSVVTLIVTISDGQVSTTVSTHSLAAVTLGLPPGWSAGSALRIPLPLVAIAPCIVVAWSFFT